MWDTFACLEGTHPQLLSPPKIHNSFRYAQNMWTFENARLSNRCRKQEAKTGLRTTLLCDTEQQAMNERRERTFVHPTPSFKQDLSTEIILKILAMTRHIHYHRSTTENVANFTTNQETWNFRQSGEVFLSVIDAEDILAFQQL